MTLWQLACAWLAGRRGRHLEAYELLVAAAIDAARIARETGQVDGLEHNRLYAGVSAGAVQAEQIEQNRATRNRQPIAY